MRVCVCSRDSVECQVHADVAPQTVKWLMNGQELVQSDRVETSYLEDVGIAHLTVHQVGPADSGEYTCMVVGEVVEPRTGERKPKTITSTSQVTVTGKSRAYANAECGASPVCL